jgi:ketosteroid isomerase-like protein
MIDRPFAEAFAAEWIAAWNAHDLERILSHYADDFEMSSPFIVQRMGEASGRLRGKTAMRAYWGPALAGELHFTLEEVLVGVDALTILYRRQDGQRVAETIEFDAARHAVRAAAHYADDFEMRSPFIVQRMGEPSGRLRGKAVMRAYWGPALADGELHFTLEEVLLGVDALTILYRRHDGGRVAETIEFDAARHAVRAAAHYGPRQA